MTLIAVAVHVIIFIVLRLKYVIIFIVVVVNILIYYTHYSLELHNIIQSGFTIAFVLEQTPFCLLTLCIHFR